MNHVIVERHKSIEGGNTFLVSGEDSPPEKYWLVVFDGGEIALSHSRYGVVMDKVVGPFPLHTQAWYWLKKNKPSGVTLADVGELVVHKNIGGGDGD